MPGTCFARRCQTTASRVSRTDAGFACLDGKPCLGGPLPLSFNRYVLRVGARHRVAPQVLEGSKLTASAWNGLERVTLCSQLAVKRPGARPVVPSIAASGTRRTPRLSRIWLTTALVTEDCDAFSAFRPAHVAMDHARPHEPAEAVKPRNYSHSRRDVKGCVVL